MIRLAVIVRDQYCQLTGGRDQPAACCKVRHVDVQGRRRQDQRQGPYLFVGITIRS